MIYMQKIRKQEQKETQLYFIVQSNTIHFITQQYQFETYFSFKYSHKQRLEKIIIAVTAVLHMVQPLLLDKFVDYNLVFNGNSHFRKCSSFVVLVPVLSMLVWREIGTKQTGEYKGRASRGRVTCMISAFRSSCSHLHRSIHAQRARVFHIVYANVY